MIMTAREEMTQKPSDNLGAGFNGISYLLSESTKDRDVVAAVGGVISKVGLTSSSFL